MRDATDELPERLERPNTDSALVAPCQLTFGETAGLRQATLSNGAVRAEILLDKGANVRQFWHAPSGARTLAESNDWLEQLTEFRRSGGHGCGSYSDCYEGGWQDVLPARARWHDGAIGDGAGVGEAATVPWEITRSLSTPDAAYLICHARLPRSRLEVLKRFALRRYSAALRVETTIRNTSGRDVRLSWTQHPALGGDLMDDSSRVYLPGGHARVRREADGRHVAVGGNDRPVASGAASAAAAAGDGAGSGWVTAGALGPATAGSPDAFVTFANVARGEAALLSRAQGLGVRLRWDAAFFPHAWLWCARRDAISCVAVEPSTTYLPELVSDAGAEVMDLLRAGDSLRTSLAISSFSLAARRVTDA